ncbi:MULTISPECIES: hypothetical protein [Flavobacteriaceae]|uniref:hypothetical protein n=1 Tax=Flavobacteriaceae TaxID=49546 RepID=UPI00234B7E53|nr:hypothetical protein [Muricauda sp. SP22]MDC6362496.1 hypothetical protein [Muricauda sp. SP22]
MEDEELYQSHIEKISFIYNGEKLSVEVDLSEKEPLYNQTDDFRILNEVLSSENSVIYINPDMEFPVLFEDNQSFEESKITDLAMNIRSNNEAKGVRMAENNNDFFWDSSFTIYEHTLFGGQSFKRYFNPEYYNPDSYMFHNPNLKTCTYFGFSFNDRISSLKVENCYLILYEHINYGGKKVILDVRQSGLSSVTLSASNLGAWKFRSFTHSVGPNVPYTTVPHCSSSWCSDWGDEISSIYATVGKQGSLIPNPSLNPPCGTTSGGSGGGTPEEPPYTDHP